MSARKSSPAYGILSLLALVGAAGCEAPAYFEGFAPLVIDDSVQNPVQHPLLGAWVQSEYWLDLSPPTMAELAALRPAGAEPVDMEPWIRREDLEVSISWRLENRSDQEIVAWVLLDGASEFYDWNPVALYGMGGGEDADELPFPSLLGFSPRRVPGNAVVQGEFREDDTREAVYDLDVLTRFCGGPLAVIYNRSEVDPIGTTEVPPDAIIAGMVMLRLTLGSSGPAELTYSIRVRERDSVLYDRREDDARWDPMPEPYVPSGFAQVPAGGVDPSTTTTYCTQAAP